MKPKVSIIMPVYNSEQYVRDAIASVLSQDFDGFELVVVDDGSSDSSGSICDEIASADARVQVLHKENGGMCQARNLGLEHARGEYVSFCDNDDEMLPGFIADNYQLAEEHDADVVRFGRTQRRISASGEVVRESSDAPPLEGVLSTDDIHTQPQPFFDGGGVWTGLYRRSMLVEGGIKFDERLRNGFEDVLFNAHVYGCAQKAVFNQGIYYIWKRRESHSASMAVSDNKLLGLSLVLEAEDSLFEAHGIYEANPRFCAQRLVSFSKDMLTFGHYRSDRSRLREYQLYERLCAIYEPYRDKVCAQPIDFQFAIMRDLLLSRRYRTLYDFIYAGVAFKGRFGGRS